MTDVIEIENFLSGGECNRLIKIHKKLFVSQGWLHNETEVLDFMCMLSSQNENDIFIKYIHGKITDHIKSVNKSNFINLGSLISDGSTTLDNTTEYKITFTSTTKLDNILGLISIGATDAVNKAGVQLKVKVK